MITTLDKEGERIMLTQTGRLTLAAKKEEKRSYSKADSSNSIERPFDFPKIQPAD